MIFYNGSRLLKEITKRFFRVVTVSTPNDTAIDVVIEPVRAAAWD
jgi:hypothetical protein